MVLIFKIIDNTHENNNNKKCKSVFIENGFMSNQNTETWRRGEKNYGNQFKNMIH